LIEYESSYNPEYQRITNCRSCNSPQLEGVLSLGDQRIVSFTEDDKKPPKVPLSLVLCGDCNLLQLRHTTRPDLLWGNEYGYKSGVNETMRNELGDIAHKSEQIVDLKQNDIVVDIGCNDGTLLKAYTKDPIRVGFDPSINVAKYALDYFHTLPSDKWSLFVDYFKKELYLNRYPKNSAKIITAIAMFYDLDNPNKFLQGVRDCLHPDGVFVIQQNYLKGMLDQLAFDNICHEHLEYYSLLSLEPLLKRNGLEVFDVSQNNINGGSFRTYIRHKGSEIGGRESWETIKMRRNETDAELDERETYQLFAEKVKNNGQVLKDFIDQENEKGKKIYVYGASTRGGTLLQFCGIDNTQIVGAAERNPDKWGRVMKSTGIPIVSEEEARFKADIFLVLPWFFKKEFVEREQGFIKKGGRLVFPLPRFEVISK